MTGELKPLPCPLCGESVEAENVGDPWKPGHWVVGCNTCYENRNTIYVEGDSYPEAITAWNTRPREAELEAEVGRLREGVRRALTYMDPMSPGHSSHKMADARRVLQTAISHPKGADE